MIIMVEGVEMDLLTPWAAVACAKGSGPMAYVENSAGNVIGNAHWFAHGLSVEQIEAVARIMAAGPKMLFALHEIQCSYVFLLGILSATKGHPAAMDEVRAKLRDVKALINEITP